MIPMLKIMARNPCSSSSVSGLQLLYRDRFVNFPSALSLLIFSDAYLHMQILQWRWASTTLCMYVYLSLCYIQHTNTKVITQYIHAFTCLVLVHIHTRLIVYFPQLSHTGLFPPWSGLEDLHPGTAQEVYWLKVAGELQLSPRCTSESMSSGSSISSCGYCLPGKRACNSSKPTPSPTTTSLSVTSPPPTASSSSPSPFVTSPSPSYTSLFICAQL